MKLLHGLSSLTRVAIKPLHHFELAELLLEDLQCCCFYIYGSQSDKAVLLSELNLLPDALYYERFDQRIDLTFKGEIKRNDCPPLTYRLQGRLFAITGRCSVIGKVCGVDLYLNSSFSGQLGGQVHLKYKIDLSELIRICRQHAQ